MVQDSVYIANEEYLSLISLPLLRSVGGNLLFSNLAFAGSSLPSLNSVGGDFTIEWCPNAMSLGLGSLSAVSGNFRVNANSMLNTINIGPIGSIGGDVYVCQNSPSFILPNNLVSRAATLQGLCVLQSGATACGTYRRCIP
jgi:hypothetical protein